MPEATKLFTLLFADDTTFQLASNNLDQLFEQTNLELAKAATWFQANKLTLNISKTKYILFRSKNMKVNFENYNLKLGNEIIERIGSDCKTKFFKFVGHHLDEYLSWDFHINHVSSKLASANYAIARTKNFLPQNIRLTLYNSLFKSHMEHGILAWGGLNQGKLKKITILQKKAVRNITGKNFRSHTDPLFSKLKILKFSDLFQFNASVFMYKYTNKLVPESYADMFLPLHGSNRTNSYKIDIIKSNYLSQFPSYFLPKIWNKNNITLKNLGSTNCFKNALRKDILNSYSILVRCKDKKCRDCHSN